MTFTASFSPILVPHLKESTLINPTTIVDDVFVLIEKDPTLLSLYHTLGGAKNNGQISKIIKGHYKLENVQTSSGANQKCTKPTSTLIKTGYQVFKR